MCLQVADAAKAHLEKAQSMRESLPAEAIPILLPAVSIMHSRGFLACVLLLVTLLDLPYFAQLEK